MRQQERATTTKIIKFELGQIIEIENLTQILTEQDYILQEKFKIAKEHVEQNDFN